MRRLNFLLWISIGFLGVWIATGCVYRANPIEARKSLEMARRLEAEKDFGGALEQYRQAFNSDREGQTALEALYKTGQIALSLAENPRLGNSERGRYYQEAVQAFESLRTHAYTRWPTPTIVRIGPQDKPLRLKVPEDTERWVREAWVKLDRFNSHKIQYKLMDFLVSATGRNPAFSYWLAILIFTIGVRLLLWPLSKAQYESSQKMMALQPRMKELQEKYKDKPEELNRRVLQLYKEAGVNPFGCGFNMFVQMGILIILYGIIRDYQFQFQKGHFLWIGSSLSRLYPQFLAPNLALPDKPLLLLYAISMYLSQKLTMIPNPDPAQQQSQQMMAIMMPLMFLFILQTFPSAFTLYWLLFNIFTTVQQLLIMKKFRSNPALAAVSVAPPDPPKSVKPRPSKPRRRRS